jgi:alpha-glucosidase
VVRHATRWSAADNDAVARQAIALMVSLQGAKCLYQGEELGQTETELTFDEIVDPPGLKFWPEYKGRDGCRTPMVWDADLPHAGFTTATPWLPVKAPQARHAVAAQEDDPDSMLNHYRRVLGYYRSTPALGVGNTTFIDTPEPILAFQRDGAVPLLCVFNLSADDMALDTSAELTLDAPSRAVQKGGTLHLPGYGWAWAQIGDTDLVSLSVTASS